MMTGKRAAVAQRFRFAPVMETSPEMRKAQPTMCRLRLIEPAEHGAGIATGPTS